MQVEDNAVSLNTCPKYAIGFCGNLVMSSFENSKLYLIYSRSYVIVLCKPRLITFECVCCVRSQEKK